jgi:hypothetical protein
MELLDLRRLLRAGIRPDLLLVEVLPPFLAGQAPHELLRLPPSRVWLHEVRALGRFGARVRELRSDWLRAWPIPWYAHRYALVSHFLPAWLPYQYRMDWLYRMDDSGCVGNPPVSVSPEAHQVAVAMARKEYEVYFANFRLEGPSGQALCELLDVCRREKIHAALVLMPEGSDFRSLYPVAIWTQIEAFLSRLKQEQGVSVINAREWIADEGFSDSHHLLARGAEEFSERLGRETLVPLILGPDS